MSVRNNKRSPIIEIPNPKLTKPLDLILDRLTPCLRHNKSGEIYPTVIQDLNLEDLRLIAPQHDWNNFDWAIYFNNTDFPNCMIKKLLIKGQEDIQGVISFEPKVGYVEIHLAESAPWNVKGKLFSGVGPHLFAIACKESFDRGFGGFVTFVAKNKLINHYKETLGAQTLNEKARQMVIESQAATKLVSTYF